MLDQQKQVRRSAQVLAAAQGHIDRGELSRGAQLLGGLKHSESRAVFLMNDLEAKRERLQRAPQLREQLQAYLEAGRLDLADLLAAELRSIDSQSLESLELLGVLDQCSQAWHSIETGAFRRAEETLRRVASILPAAKWVGETSRHISEIAHMMEEVRSGPLGMMKVGGSTKLNETMPPSAPVNTVQKGSFGSLPSRFILRVDGAGSFLVLRQPSITIGPVSSSRVPDVGVIAEPGLPLATIDRVEDDYFLRGGATGGNKLLASGDAIALSPRCRMTFGLPHVASTTAVIDLTAARYPRAEIRRIILLDGDLVIGPGANVARAGRSSDPAGCAAAAGRSPHGRRWGDSRRPDGSIRKCFVRDLECVIDRLLSLNGGE